MTSGVERATEILRVVTAAGFVVLAIIALRQWLRVRDAARTFLAVALGLLALVSVISQVSLHTDYRFRIIGDLSIIVFMGSAYFLLMFRHAYVPLSRFVRVLATVATVGATVAFIAARLPYGPQVRYEGTDRFFILALICVWAVLVGEPTLRFWMVSRTKPAVQRARLRALSIAYGTIILVLFVAVIGDVAAHPWLALNVQLIATLLIVLISFSIAPPRWLRRAWRAREEENLRASEDLIVFAENRSVLAERALEWGMRLVGATGGFLSDADGALLAVQGFDDDDASELAKHAHRVALVTMPDDDVEPVILAQVQTGRGLGALGVRSGPFAMLFGSDEQERLGRHATLVGTALDRVRVTEELRALDAARREFISNAAHELRTPLTAILGLSSILETQSASFSEPDRLEMIEAIHRQAVRMRTLVNNLLDLSQIEQGKLSVRLRPVVLRDVVASALSTVTPPEGTRVDIDVDGSLRVHGDALRIEQIVTNLVTNAYRHGGRAITLSAWKEPPCVVIAVSDDGPGIPADVAPHLFEPFWRARAVTGTEGHGLGLAIVKGLVEALGGDIWYDTSFPRGARFVFRLKEVV